MFPRGIVLTVFRLDVSDQFSLTVGFQVRDVLAFRNNEKGRTRPFKQLQQNLENWKLDF